MKANTKFTLGLSILFAALVVVSAQAEAQAQAVDESTSAAGDVPVLKMSWTPPATRVNGSPLAAEEIAGYRIGCQQADGDGEVTRDVGPDEKRDPYATPKAALFPAYGNYDCTLTVKDTDDRESTPSAAVAVAWDKPVKAPAVAPADLRVVAQPEQGDTVKLVWESPTVRADGTPAEPEALDYYTVMCNGYNSGNAESLITLPADGTPTREIKRTELFTSYGDYKCRAKVSMQDGADSAWSEYVRVNWRDAPPAPVTNVLIVTDTK